MDIHECQFAAESESHIKKSLEQFGVQGLYQISVMMVVLLGIL